MVSDRLAIRSVLPVIVLLAILAWDRFRGPEMRRPLTYDELFTIEHYTWAWVKPSGEGEGSTACKISMACPVRSQGSAGGLE